MVNPNGRNIALIGAMGSGKSAWAKLYSETFGVPYFDTDEEITRRYGSISGIFEREGEQTFRKYELEAVKEAIRYNPYIIACGGGVVLSHECMAILRRHCDIVWLTAPVEVLKDRIASSDRPLKTELERLVKEREPLYRRYADYIFDNSDEPYILNFMGMLLKPRKNRYDVVLCDADDTLLDFKTAMRYSVLHAAHTVGVKTDDETVVKVYAAITNEIWGALERKEITREELDRKRFGLFVERLGESVDPHKMKDLFITAMCKTRYILNGSIEFLRKVRARGAKVYIATNSFKHIASERLKALEGEHDGYFISQDIGYEKPDTRYFNGVFDKIGNPDKSRVIMVGDSNTADIAGGKNAGIDTCFFDPSGRLETSADYRIRAYDDFFDIL
ncbi:MAG: HAD-IA family hydrolase [Clostridiales bacterium]|nr:HAD-IA family hydrolase [Clostridiales bacterium]